MTYARPNDLADALHIVATTHSTVIAGATDVYPATRPGKHAAHYLDLTNITELRGITRDPSGYRIGAATPWSQIIAADLPPAIDALKQAAAQVGSVQIQNTATIAGNLCNASPAADGVPPLLALDATVEVTSQARGRRVVPLAAFISGVRATVLEPDELVSAILVPDPIHDAGSAFEKLGSRAYLVISIAMTAAVVSVDANGRIAQARVAVGACSPVAQRLAGLEAHLVGQDPHDLHFAREHLAELTPISDIRGSADYRLHAVPEQIRRAVRRAADHE